MASPTTPSSSSSSSSPSSAQTPSAMSTDAAPADRENPAVPTPPSSSSSASSASPVIAPTDALETVAAAVKDEAEVKKDGEAKKHKCPHRKVKAEKEKAEKEEKEKGKEKEAAASASVPEKEKADKEKADKEKAEKEKEEKDKEEKEKAEKKEKKDKKEKKARKSKKSKKSKRKSKKRRDDSSDDDSASSSDESADSDASSSSDDSSDSSSESSSSGSETEDDVLEAAVRLLLSRRSHRSRKAAKLRRKKEKAKKRKKEEKKARKRAARAAGGEEEEDEEAKEPEDKDRASVLEYKRVDHLFDKELHDWAIQDTVPHSKADMYSSYVFTVRRVFDYEGKYQETIIDIKSPLLKDALLDIMGDVRGVSLVEDVPEMDPNMLFNYREELAAWAERAANPDASKEVKEEGAKKTRKRKPKIDPATGAPAVPLTEEEVKQQISHVKLVLEYLDTDFESTKATLFPLLENKSITFDLMWALLKPNTVMYTTCAGSNEPRAFRLDYAQQNCSFMRGKWWSVEGRYLEYDGKEDKDSRQSGGFGWGSVNVDIDQFRGARKIQGLACYPLSYRKDHEEMKAKLVERGKKFVSLRGMQYKAHNGFAFTKKKRQYLKVHVKGRIMIDPVTFRRINPNYVISSVKSRNSDLEDDENANYFTLEDEEEDEDEADDEGEGEGEDACSDCCCDEDKPGEEDDEEEKERKAMRYVKDDKGEWQIVTKGEEEEKTMKVDQFEKNVDDEDKVVDSEPELEDADYMIASPVVLGWAFTEKLWLEFPVSTVEEIKWNDKAFDSLVLPEDQKAIVRALVESHTANTDSDTIDDIIAGKGRGLVSVLHGPPGVGKTLTAEGISELLHKPLYCVSSGELGTTPAQLEHELQKILDIAHSWGAVLLIDEADVYMEKRTFADMHRNALVSIFLRLLEYFQGILFLTTNRVETFDEAFQSRIHIALRYSELDRNAKRTIWKTFLGMVSSEELTRAIASKKADDAEPVLRDIVTTSELDNLARRNLNGRQIKNIVRTSQALANSKSQRLSMEHLIQALEVTERFEHDLKGTGQLDGMMSYA